MTYLFFDTETTGVPSRYNARFTDLSVWTPRMIQIGWLLTDEQGQVLNRCQHYIRPDGFTVPAEVTRITGLTTEFVAAHGDGLRSVLLEFLSDLNRADRLIGHNVSFDVNILGAELVRTNMDYSRLDRIPKTCTMQASTDYCRIPGRFGYKWPRLQELHVTLFGHEFESAHDAMADIEATCRCFFELRRRGVVR